MTGHQIVSEARPGLRDATNMTAGRANIAGAASANAQGRADELIMPHVLYTYPGRSRASRQAAYRRLFKSHVDATDLKNIRAAWQTGTPIGNDCFREKVERKLGSKIGQGRRERPFQRALRQEGAICD